MKNAKRFLAVFLSFAMALSLLPVLRLTGAAAEIVESGPCGDTAAYTLDEEGNLVITGSGAVTEDLFSNRDDIVSVEIGEGITGLRWHQFKYSYTIESVHLPSTLTVVPDQAFNGCVRLSEVNLTNALTEIGFLAFGSCALSGDLYIPENVRVIDAYAFNNCQQIEHVYIPAGVETIGADAFAMWGPVLKGIYVDENNDYFTSVDGSLYSKNMTRLLAYATERNNDWNYEGEYTEYDLPDTVTAMDAEAFNAAFPVSAINVGEENPAFCAVDGVLFNKDMTVLLKYPMAKSDSLYRVPDGVTELAKSAFSGAANLKTLLLPETLTEIGSGQFTGCGIKSLRIPDGVETIRSFTFNYATSLKEITLSAGLKRIEDNAFPANCAMFDSVYFLNSEEDWNAITISNNEEYQIIHTEEGDILSMGSGNEALMNATVYFTFAKGDVDLDGHVTPADARMILRGAVGLDVVSFARSDLNNDGNLTPADARLAMRVCVFLEDPSSMECATPVSPTFTEFEGGADKIRVDASFEDDTMTLTFTAGDFAGTTDGEMFIGFDPEKLEYISGSVTLDCTDADWEENPAITQTGCQNGLYTFAFYYEGRAAAEESGLVSLTFRLLDADFGTVNYGFGDWNGTAVPAAGCYPVYESNTPVIEYNGHYYTVFYEGLSWADAQSKCEELGGHLVSITTPQENAVIARLSGGECWIGAECYDGAISWVTGEEAGFSNWAEDQPDNTDDEQHWVCQWSDGTWDDEFADSGYNYACEWDSAENCPWEAQEVWHVVTFDGNGAAGETAPQVAVAGEPFTLPSGDYEWPEGQKLHGWQIGDETYLAGDSIAIEEDVTATAVWGAPGQLTSTVTVDAAENVATLTVSARNFVNTRSGTLIILYDNTEAEFLDAEATVAEDFHAAWNVMTEEEAAQYDNENENRRGVTLSFFFTDAARDEDFDLITLRFRLLPGKVATFYSSSVEWDGFEPWSGDLYNVAFGRPEAIYSYNGHSYALIDGSGDMEDPGTADYHSSSETLCELVGGHLVTITTEQENAAARYTACRAGEETETYARTGGSYHDGAVSWITGEDALYVMWGDDTPEVEGNLLMLGYMGGFWEVADGSWCSAILCEWEPGECPWEADKTLHTVGFDGNGAEGEMRMLAVAENDVFTLPECDFAAPENKSFGGWALNEDVYAAEDEITVSEDTVFTAVWNDVAEEHTEHEWDEGEVTTPPTCTEAGVRTYTCVVCGDTREEAVAATGHAWGEWTVVKAATCEEEGLEQRVCANDEEHIERNVIPQTEHEDADHDGQCDICRTNVCKYCGKVHPNNFMGRILQFVHTIAYFFAHLFGKM